jgi:hypothetical protein
VCRKRNEKGMKMPGRRQQEVRSLPPERHYSFHDFFTTNT